MIFLGPFAVEVTLHVSRGPHDAVRRWLPWIYGAAFSFAAMAWTTTWIIRGLVPVPWGNVIEPGPLFAPFCAFIVVCGVIAYRLCAGLVRETSQLKAIWSDNVVVYGILATVAAGALTDAILPLLGFQVPRLATTAFGVLACCLLWSMSRPEGRVFASAAIISQEILRSLNEGVAFVTLEDRIILANEGMGTFLGTDPDRLLGQPFQHHLPDLALDEPQQRIDVETHLIPTSGPPFAVAASVSTARDLRGAPLGLVVVLRDLREVEQLRSRLITSGRLAAVGELAAGIAHEINNPIAFVRTNLSVLSDHWAVLDGELSHHERGSQIREILDDGSEIIEESIEGVDRAASIVRDVREFSHAGMPEREQTNLNELLERVTRVASPELSADIQIELALGAIPEVLASPQQLKQVFLNLVVNAIHAIERHGHIRISTELEEGFVAVRIEDDGCGIPTDQAERIFDPFYTTKPVGQGTGLGLSISHEIIRKHAGEIGLEPSDGPGCCFCVRLPIGPDVDQSS
jgi:signal transduction histidine kinase